MALPLADVIDIAAERARLDKASAKLAKEIGGLNGRLANPKFIASAPPEIVEETQANLALKKDEAGKIGVALLRLTEME